MHTTTNHRFRSKVDSWLALVLVLLGLSAIATPVVLFATGDPNAWIGLIPTALIVGIFGLLVFPLHYELADEQLVIRFGVVRSRIPYADIRRVVPTQSMLGSPALSMDRLHVDSGNPLGPLISPADKSGFLDALAAKAPHLVREGDSLQTR